MAGVPPGEPEEAEMSHAGAPTSLWQIELHVTGNIISCYLSQKPPFISSDYPYFILSCCLT